MKSNLPSDSQDKPRTTELSDLISLTEACRRLPKRLHPSTVFRWVQKGRAGIRLKVVSVGGTRCTTESWLLEFFEAVERARLAQGSTPRRSSISVQKNSPRHDSRKRPENLHTQEILRRHGLSSDG
jgi:hypothetical protein